MRRLVRITLVGALFVLLTSSVASAATIFCPGGVCRGGGGGDRFIESPFNDLIIAGGGKDRIQAQFFEGEFDFVRAGAGNDRVNTDDDDRLDTIRCGGGDDVVRADRGDKPVNKDACERINRS